MRRSGPPCIGLFLALAMTIIGQPLLASAHADAVPATSSANGPVGWDIYRHLDRLPELTTGVQTQQFSSFDRGGVNGDAANTLAHAADGYVLAEHQGPGEVDSIWSTRDEGDVRATGNIRITLDGETVVNAPLQDLVDGKLGAPFVFPVVTNATQSSGGVTINAPMPFRQSMRITTDADPVYYEVTTRTFADASGLATFDPTDRALDVIAQLTAAGTRDPKVAQPNAVSTQRSFALAPGQAAQLGALTGPGTISGLQLHLPQLVPPQAPTSLTDDGRAFGRDSGAYSQFTVATDPDNAGVRLTRRLNPQIANQRADIFVDGVKVAAWAPVPAPRDRTWLDQSVVLPSSSTAGKSHVTIRNVFVSSANDFNEYAYWADSLVDGQPQRTDAVDVGPQHTADEQAHQYSIAEQTYAGTWVSSYPPTAQERSAVLATTDVLAGARLRVTVDGQRTVDAPLGEFFGSARRLSSVRALMYAMDPATKSLSAWWSMPYAQRADVELYNGSGQTISSGDATLTAAANTDVASALGPEGNLGYFRTTANHADTVPGQDYVFLEASGWGKFVGVTHTMVGAATRNFLEGDERVYVDGSRTPQIHGTGTEDFYRGGWYFNRGTFSDPLFGNPTHETATADCPTDCTGAYRLMLAEAVPFHSALSFGIEHGPVNDAQATYSSTAYWYGKTLDGRSATVQRHTDTLDVGAAASEQAHHYTAAGDDPVTTVTSTYEGNDGVPAPVTDTVRAATDQVSFTLGVAADNTGVTLHRMSDQRQAGQSVQVFVDGRDAGTWRQPLGNPFFRWLDDSFALPPALTQTKTQVTVRLVPTVGAPPFAAARYDVLSTVAPFLDQQPPAQVAGLHAQGVGFNNVIDLTWQPGVDDVGIDHYAVYGSTDPAFTLTPATLLGPATRLGTAKVNSFSHRGLGLAQIWHYRVVAVDAAGNHSAPSVPAAAIAGIIPGFATTTIVGGPLIPAVGAAIPLFATVTPPLVVGTVSFFDGDRPIAGCTDRQVVFGYANCVSTFTTAGVHPITATYNGDGVHLPSSGYAALHVSEQGDFFRTALSLLINYLHEQHLLGL